MLTAVSYMLTAHDCICLYADAISGLRGGEILYAVD